MAGERGPVRPAGAGDGVFESRGRSPEPRSSAGCRRRASGRSTGAGWSAQNGDIYHYEVFDAKKNEFHQFAVYHLDPARWDLRSMTRANRVALTRPRPAPTASRGVGMDGVRPAGRASFPRPRERNVTKTVVKYDAVCRADAAARVARLLQDRRARRGADDVRAAESSTSRSCRLGGYNVVPYMVALQRKVAFPFVTVVMTLLAVPFAVTTGRRGALYGVGVGIVLAITYWLMLSVCAAIGAGGLLPPVLAAWTPNILFGAAAAYLILTVRT